jgi:hypothetical protein
MFYQGPQINVILTDDEQKGTRIDAAHEKRKLMDPTRGIKKRASSDLIVLLADAPLEKEASLPFRTDGIALMVLELAEIEKKAQVARRIGRAIFPGKLAPPVKKPKPLQPKPTPEAVARAAKAPEKVRGRELEVAVRETPKGYEFARQKGEPAPKGFEFLKRRPTGAKFEGEKVTKRLRTPVGEAVSKIPLVGKKLAPGVEARMTPEEYKVMRAKVISGDIPRQLLATGVRGVKAIGRGVRRAAEYTPGVGHVMAARRAIERMPVGERVEHALMKRKAAKGQLPKEQKKAFQKLEKKLTAPPKAERPEVEGLPKWMRTGRGRKYMEREAVPGQKRWTAFTKQTEPEQAKSIFGSLYVRGRKGGERKATFEEAQAAVKEYRKTGDLPGDLKGPLGEAFMASQPFREPKKSPEWLKKKKPTPESPQAVAAEERQKAFMVGAKRRGREAKKEDWREQRKERLKEEAAGRPEAKVEGVAPVPGKAPKMKGKEIGPQPEAIVKGREEIARKAKEFKEKYRGKVPPVTPAAPAAAAAAPKTVAELRGIAQAGKMHTVDVKTIRDIANKEFAHDPQAAAQVTRQFVEQRQVMGDAAKRRAAAGEGLDVAAGKPKAPAAPPAEKAPAGAPPPGQAQQVMDAAVRSAETSGSAVQVATNMLTNAQSLPAGPERDAALLRAQRFHQEVQAVPPAGAGAKVREYLTANPQDVQLTFQRPAGTGAAVVETGGPATVPYAAPKMQITAGEGKEGAKNRKAAEQWVKDMRHHTRAGENFDPTDMGQFQQAKEQFGIPPKAEKAFTQVGQAPPEATTRTFVTGPESGIPAVSEQAQKEMQARAVAESLGLAQPTTAATGAAPGGGLPATTPGAGFQAMYRPQTGGAPASPEALAAQQQRMMDVISGKQTPEMQALMGQAGVKPGGGFMEGAAGIAPWILMPSLLGAMGFEGMLPQLAGYAMIPSLQGKIQSMMGRDPEAIRRVQEAYVKGLKSVPAAAKGGGGKAGVPAIAGPAAAGQAM